MASSTLPGSADSRALRFALILVAVLTIMRVAILFVSPLNLYPDEAQYWLWSRTLDFGYFSKPPMIAWAIAATTGIGGDSEAWVRLSAPLFHAVAALAIFGTGRKLYGAWAGLAATALYSLMPGLQLSSGVISTDAPLLCFLAVTLLVYVSMQEGQRRIAAAGALGVALGLAMLSKYAAIYAVVGIGLHVAISRDARRAWTPAAIGITVLTFALVLAPNLIWNAHHGFATVSHTAANADWGARKLFNPAELLEFLVGQLGVFGPIPFGVLVVGGVLLAMRKRLEPADSLLLCFILPALIVVTVQAFISRANANWAASAYVGASVLVAGWLIRWRPALWAKALLWAAIALQVLFAGVFMASVGNPAIGDKLGMSNSFKRLKGWDALTEATILRAETERASGGLTAIAVDDRFAFNALAYYGRGYFGREGAPPLVIWTRGGVPGNQAEASAPLTAANGGRVLTVALDADRKDAIAADFKASRVVEVATFSRGPKPKYNLRVLMLMGEDFQPRPRGK